MWQGAAAKAAGAGAAGAVAALLLVAAPVDAAAVAPVVQEASQPVSVTSLARPLKKEPVDKGRVWGVLIGGAVVLFTATVLAGALRACSVGDCCRCRCGCACTAWLRMQLHCIAPPPEHTHAHVCRLRHRHRHRHAHRHRQGQRHRHRRRRRRGHNHWHCTNTHTPAHTHTHARNTQHTVQRTCPSSRPSCAPTKPWPWGERWQRCECPGSSCLATCTYTCDAVPCAQAWRTQ